MTVENWELKAMDAESECISLVLDASTNKHPALPEVIRAQAEAYQRFNDVLLLTRRTLEDSLETNEDTTEKERQLHQQAAIIWEKCAEDIKGLLR
jgi:hypothetical protein